MNSREIVRSNLEFDNPERVAYNFFGFKSFRDFVNASPTTVTKETKWQQVDENRWERRDQYGNLWARVEDHSAGEVVKGALEGIDDIYDYEFPDYSKSEDFETVRKVRSENPDMWLNSGIPFTFTVARKMFRMDNYLMYLLLELDKMRVLHDKIDKMAEDKIRSLGESGVDSVMIAEDWGTQDRTLISPDLWREEFYPRYKKLCGITHEYGMKFIMHSCGKIEKIVPWLIEAGVDVFQFDQPELHGVEKLASYQEGNKISFWCPVDIQRTLQTKDEQKIRSAARNLLDHLWKGRGGFIASIYPDNKSIGLEPEWQEYAKDEYVKYGVRENFMNVCK